MKEIIKYKKPIVTNLGLIILNLIYGFDARFYTYKFIVVNNLGKK